MYTPLGSYRYDVVMKFVVEIVCHGHIISSKLKNDSQVYKQIRKHNTIVFASLRCSEKGEV